MLSLRAFCLVALSAAIAVQALDAAKVVCFYDGTSFHREGVAKADNITEAALLCDQLIYGYYKINSDYELETSFKYPYPKGKNVASQLKLVNSNLKVLLGVAGNVLNRKADRALKVIESPETRTTFVNSVYKTVVDFGYDGVDLGWQWPETFRDDDKQFMDNGIVNSVKDFWGNLKAKLRETPAYYAEGFHALVRELRAVLKPSGKVLSISALPHVNATAYFDLANLKDITDQFILHTYDYRAPQYFPTLADYSAPLHFKNASHRHPSYNIEATVSQWLSAGVPSEKLIITIPTFGRAWAVDDSIKEMVKLQSQPPYRAKEAAAPGSHTKIKGLVSYYEVCPHLVNYNPSSTSGSTATPAGTTLLNRVTDNEKRLGSYCFRVPGVEEGVWISYEEPETAGVKAAFAKLKKLGGVAVLDLSLDDFKGMCTGTAFPILKAVRQNLA